PPPDPSVAAPEPRALTVSAAQAGTRLDRYLAAALPDLSRARLQALIAGGHVRVEGRAARPSSPVREGDRITVAVPEAAPALPAAEDIPLAVVHEDAHLVVVDKPAG